MKNAGKRAHDADSDDTKGEDSTRKKQKTVDSAKQANNDDGSGEEDEHAITEEAKCIAKRVDECCEKADDYYEQYAVSSIHGGFDKCFSWRMLSSKCATLTATLEEFASKAVGDDNLFIKVGECKNGKHVHTRLDRPYLSVTEAALVSDIDDYECLLEDESEEFAKDTILERRHAITRSCLNKWCDSYSHCHLGTDQNERNECLGRLQQAIERDALDKLPKECGIHYPPCDFRHGSRGTQQDITTMWAQAHGVKSFSTCDKKLLGTWTSKRVRLLAKNVTLNGEKFPELPIDYVQPRDLDVTFDGLERGLTLREVIEQDKGK